MREIVKLCITSLPAQPGARGKEIGARSQLISRPDNLIVGAGWELCSGALISRGGDGGGGGGGCPVLF